MNMKFIFVPNRLEVEMKTVSLVEFRKDARSVVRRVMKGERMVLTYRGKPVMRLEPIADDAINPNDPFYSLDRLADPSGESLTNKQMDEIIYEP